MTDKMFENNQVSIAGKLASPFVFSHEVYGEGFYLCDVEVERLSDSVDLIPIMVSERLFPVKENYIGREICVHGQFRSYNRHEENRNRLVLSLFVREMSFLEESTDPDIKPNYIFLDL